MTREDIKAGDIIVLNNGNDFRVVTMSGTKYLMFPNTYRINSCLAELCDSNLNPIRNVSAIKEIYRDGKLIWTPPTEMTIAEIERDYHKCKLTAKDIVELLNSSTYSTEQVKTLAYNIYSDGEDIYYPLPSVMVQGHKYDMSLSIPREAIINNDWSIVEEKYVFSIIKPDADESLGRNPNNWYQGKQKDSPYFNTDEVAKIKSLFKI
jgi:hypothetical protein